MNIVYTYVYIHYYYYYFEIYGLKKRARKNYNLVLIRTTFYCFYSVFVSTYCSYNNRNSWF
jgi:hypothetical protein